LAELSLGIEAGAFRERRPPGKVTVSGDKEAQGIEFTVGLKEKANLLLFD
jgi:hypothetical protein